MFRGIEGLRAWLAWIVVFSHILLFSDATTLYPQMKVLSKFGGYSVEVFIIISGFVITNLILAKKEPYKIYIARRFLRIYPVYLICLLLAILSFELAFEAVSALPYADLNNLKHFSDQARELAEGRGLWHILAHLSLFHGAIPNNILMESQYMFNAPAWSLSLEWQFYLLAPFIISGLMNEKFRLYVVLAAVALFLCYQRGYFGEFYLPSIIFGSGPLFLVGIASRLVIEKIKPLDAYPIAIVVGCLVFCYWSKSMIPIVAWVWMMGYLLLSEEAIKKPDFYTKVLNFMLDSKLAKAAGDRSYSVYILHCVVIVFILYHAQFTFHQREFSGIFTFTALGTIIFTLLGSEIFYRYVEKPSIALGKRLPSGKNN